MGLRFWFDYRWKGLFIAEILIYDTSCWRKRFLRYSVFSSILFITMRFDSCFYYFFRCLAMTRQKFMITMIISAADCSPVFMIKCGRCCIVCLTARYTNSIDTQFLLFFNQWESLFSIQWEPIVSNQWRDTRVWIRVKAIKRSCFLAFYHNYG